MVAQHFEMITKSCETSYEKPQETTEDVSLPFKIRGGKAFLCAGTLVLKCGLQLLRTKQTTFPSIWDITY